MKFQKFNLMVILAGAVICVLLILFSGRSSFGLRRSPTVEKHAVGANSNQIKELMRFGLNGSQLPSVNEPSRDNIIGKTPKADASFISPDSQVNVIPVGKYESGNRATMIVSKPVALLRETTAKPVAKSLYDRDDTGRINPHGYRLLMDEPQSCYDTSGSPKDVFLLVLILTVHANFRQRDAIRETWGSPQEVGGKRIVTLFLLAYNDDALLQRKVLEESNNHHDLLQEDFIDTYRNLTLKTIMGMKWAYSHCSHASYVLKTDDDMYVSYANLVKHLADSKTPSVNYAAGFLINGSPFRDPASKWYMPKAMYPGSRYPPFLSGTGYVMSGDLTGKIYEKSLDTRYLHLEDVFVAVCLESLHIKPLKNNGFNNWRTSYSYCRYRSLITTHMVPPAEMRRIWTDQQRQISC